MLIGAFVSSGDCESGAQALSPMVRQRDVAAARIFFMTIDLIQTLKMNTILGHSCEEKTSHS